MQNSQRLIKNFTPICITMQKRGRSCIIAKIVYARPLGQLVLATPYRNRQTVQYLSMPPAVLTFARQAGAELWLVRNDITGKCYAISIDEAEKIGWRKASEGRMEIFVPLTSFKPLPYQAWDYIKNSVDVDSLPLISKRDSDPMRPAISEHQQLMLFGGVL